MNALMFLGTLIGFFITKEPAALIASALFCIGYAIETHK